MPPKLGKKILVGIKFSWRQVFQGKYLLLTNTLATGSLLALGDVLEQSRVIYKAPSEVRDWKRTGCMFVMGCSLGPPLHYWYSWLERIYAGKALSVLGKKVLVDQLFAQPVTGVWYFLGLSAMEGQTLSEGWEEFKDKFWELYKADWCVWPAAQMINFYFLSPKYRVLYICIITLGWDVYLSHLKNKNKNKSQLTAVASDSSAVDEQQKALLPSKLLEENASRGSSFSL